MAAGNGGGDAQWLRCGARASGSWGGGENANAGEGGDVWAAELLLEMGHLGGRSALWTAAAAIVVGEVFVDVWHAHVAALG